MTSRSLILPSGRERMFEKLTVSSLKNFTDNEIYNLGCGADRFCYSLISFAMQEFGVHRSRLALLDNREILELSRELLWRAKRKVLWFRCFALLLIATVVGALVSIDLYYYYAEKPWQEFYRAYNNLSKAFGKDYFPYEIFKKALGYGFAPDRYSVQELSQLLAPSESINKRQTPLEVRFVKNHRWSRLGL